MLFDISIPIWAYGFRMMINPTIQIDTIFIIAILTTMWYSINDTIIIFDRIRENMREHGDREKGTLIYWKIFEKSLRQTMRRSMGTSISTLLVIVAMYILGTGVIQQFAFTMWIWVLAGTFSSIFVAAPLAYLIIGKYKKERKKL
jgi:SecD/SecF fusion protein